MRLIEMKALHETLLAESQVLIEKSQGAGLGSDEQRALDEKFEELEKLGVEIRRLDCMDRFGKFEPSSGPSIRGIVGGASMPEARKAEGREYRKMFPNVNLDRGEFGSFREFARDVAYGMVSERLRRSMVEESGPDGGFIVPTEYSAEVWDIALEGEIVRPRATIYPMKSNERKVPGVVIGDHSSSLSGGVICYWENELDTLTETEPTFRNINLHAAKLTALGRASNEVVEDSVGGATMEKAFGGALGWTLDRAFFSGTGAGQPLGILNAGCTIAVDAELGQDADSIIYENLTNMLSRLHPACFGNSVWIAHPTTMPDLLELTITIGGGGSHIPVMTASGGGFSILTRPVIFTEKAQPIGDLGDIMLCDFSQYVVGLRSDIRLEKSSHAGFTSDSTYFRGAVRVDGQPGWDEPLTLQDGISTVSPFVMLAAR